jgi:hypothetical protein
MKRLLFACALMFCGVATLASAQDKAKAERPTLTIGDSWTYSYEDKTEASRKGTFTNTVTAIDGDVITFTRGNQTVTTTNLDLNETRGANGRTESPHSFSYDGPLEEGKEWRREITWTNSRGDRGRSTGKRKVLSYEKVTVPAGTFDAFLIEYNGYYNNDTANLRAVSGPETIRSWYAPAVKSFVKWQRIYRANNRVWEDSTTELQSYSLK